MQNKYILILKLRIWHLWQQWYTVSVKCCYCQNFAKSFKWWLRLPYLATGIHWACEIEQLDSDSVTTCLSLVPPTTMACPGSPSHLSSQFTCPPLFSAHPPASGPWPPASGPCLPTPPLILAHPLLICSLVSLNRLFAHQAFKPTNADLACNIVDLY